MRTASVIPSVSCNGAAHPSILKSRTVESLNWKEVVPTKTNTLCSDDGSSSYTLFEK